MDAAQARPPGAVPVLQTTEVGRAGLVGQNGTAGAKGGREVKHLYQSAILFCVFAALYYAYQWFGPLALLAIAAYVLVGVRIKGEPLIEFGNRAAERPANR